MKHLRYDQPIVGDALILGARLPRRDEVPAPPPAPVETRPGVFLAPDGKFFTSLETPKGVSPEDAAARKLAKNREFAKLYGGRVHDSITMDELDDSIYALMAADYEKQLRRASSWMFDNFGNFSNSSADKTELACADLTKLEERILAVAAGVEYKHSGTVTGRMSSSRPHFKDLPRKL